MDITNLKAQIEVAFKAIKSNEGCQAFHQKYLAKNGEVTKLMQTLKDVAPEKRGPMGQLFNTLKVETEKRLFTLQADIQKREQQQKLMNDPLVDITIPNLDEKRGSLHPITLVMRDVEQVFADMGFIIEDGTEIATEYENFDSVNTPPTHPGRDMQDTFWLEKPNQQSETRHVLRTHTSAWQNYMLKKYGPEFRAISPGRCFRNESVDSTHDTTFFQVEGMMVGEDISIANLIYFMQEALTAVFKKDVKVRLRPGYFPFVEPGFELDASCIFCENGCSICKHSKWVEFCGCGMIHPNVLKMGGIDPEKYQGFAFGFGLTRLAMMRYNIDDIRLFNSGNLDFLRGVK